MQMLETLSSREWAEDGIDGDGGYRAAVVGNLPDSYQQFQYKLSCKLAKDHPELSQLLCDEIRQRQLDAVDIIAQHQVLTCMAPWIENLNLEGIDREPCLRVLHGTISILRGLIKCAEYSFKKVEVAVEHSGKRGIQVEFDELDESSILATTISGMMLFHGRG